MAKAVDQIIRSHRRSIAILITPQGKLIIKAPHLIPRFMIDRFVNEKQDWIEQRIAQTQLHPISKQKEFVHGEEFLYLGKSYPLHIVSGKKLIEVTDKLYAPNLPKTALKTALTLWYKTQAKDIIIERCALFEIKTGHKPTSIMISNARSKWGTCFHDNTMNFSWRLIMAPLSVVDYVVAHEFAHIRQKNHSRKFWETVGSFYPIYRSERRWLKKNGGLLDL